MAVKQFATPLGISTLPDVEFDEILDHSPEKGWSETEHFIYYISRANGESTLTTSGEVGVYQKRSGGKILQHIFSKEHWDKDKAWEYLEGLAEKVLKGGEGSGWFGPPKGDHIPRNGRIAAIFLQSPLATVAQGTGTFSEFEQKLAGGEPLASLKEVKERQVSDYVLLEVMERPMLIGAGIRLHEQSEFGYANKYGFGHPAHEHGLTNEINLYKSVIPGIQQYSTHDIDRAVVGHIQSKYGILSEYWEKKPPIAFKPANKAQSEIYNIVQVELEKPFTLESFWVRTHSTKIKLRLEEMEPAKLSELNDEDLNEDHDRLHRYYAEWLVGEHREEGDWSYGDLLQKHAFVVDELKKRGKKCEYDDELAKPVRKSLVGMIKEATESFVWDDSIHKTVKIIIGGK